MQLGSMKPLWGGTETERATIHPSEQAMPMIMEAPPERIRRRRWERRSISYLTSFGAAFLMIGPIGFYFLGVPGSGDIIRSYGAVALPAALLVATGWLHHWRSVQAINRVAISEYGLYPPFKPKKRLSKGDWFIPYSDIRAMEPIEERKGFVPAYDITLNDGLSFQLNALDLLIYVNEAEVRRYEKMLRVIHEELLSPENRLRSQRGQEIVIPKEKFGADVPGQH